MLNHDSWERARVVAEDLEYLSDRWRPSLDEQQLRRDSPILRRLLLNDQYGHAWRDLGLPGHPIISAPELAAFLGQTNRDYVQYATAPPGVTVTNSLLGGGQLKMAALETTKKGSTNVVVAGYGQQLGLIFASIPPEAVAAADAVGQNAATTNVIYGPRHVVEYPLPNFLSSSSALILGTEVSRGQVVKYVANKLGGAHFDPSRGRKGDDRLKPLDSLVNMRLEIPGVRSFNAVYVELLSIAEYLAQSSDAQRFRQTFSETPDPG
jgi:hypothetical protein